MKHLLAITFLYIGFLLPACNNPENKTPPPADTLNQSPVQKDLSKKDTTASSEKEYADDSLFHVSFKDSGSQEVKARLGKRGPAIVIAFTAAKPGSLLATIIPLKENCNVRINRIILPGNKSDGPFGRELQYKLPKKGDYKLEIGHNMMAGDPEACEFTLQLKIH